MGMSKTCILIGVMEAMSSEVGHTFDLVFGTGRRGDLRSPSHH